MGALKTSAESGARRRNVRSARSNLRTKKKQSDANVDAAGLRQFGTGTAEVAPLSSRLAY